MNCTLTIGQEIDGYRVMEYCKTYIAENLAYESRLNFMMVKTSDIGSTFVHGTQGKIRELYDKAAATAPTILCFDELDGMVPDRSKVTSEAIAGEVNEFLTQLNGCSERGYSSSVQQTGRR